MKKCIVSIFAMTIVQQTAYSSCILYEHDSTNGYSVTLNSGQSVSNISGYMIERRTWHGYFNGWKGSDRSFNDAASSVRVFNGCFLEVAEHLDFGGRRQTFINQRNENSNWITFNLHNYNWGDIITSASCTCPGIVDNDNKRPLENNPIVVIPAADRPR
jgi:hypothetical protein